MNRTCLPLLAGVAALLLGGCATTAPAPATSSTTPASSTAPSSSSTPPPPPPAPLPTAAADGSNLRACTDGTCEVLLDKPATINLVKQQVGTVRVAKIEADSVTLNLTFPSGRIEFNCDQGVQCSLVGATAGSPAMTFVVARTGGWLTTNGLRTQVVAVRDGVAVIRLGPA
ncbi:MULTISPECIES: hypothetical protein [unclassified Crossiella]|uniref:hypothetical protein n=1 Tax=unclassified Crossiella TaxID=2620835 RepID=UPI001FFF9A98|nr:MULTISPECIES: hypothetical protein [unclassified Crossiella]MCK2242493.1 hypothetical protein [Crossiella sp. S99.2]MCK2254477.1 hypothetical protein [Crossiella sp. S99.1]